MDIKFYARNCTENDMKQLLGRKFCENYKVSELKTGEIRKLGTWIPNKECFMERYLEENWLVFKGSVHCESEELISDYYLGTLLINNDKFDFTYCQGETADFERNAVFLDDMEKESQKFELNLQYSLEANSDKHIQVVIYPKKTCYIKYHFEMYTDTLIRKCQSKTGQAHIDVPIYETDGKFFHTLREWLIKNEIEHYCLNDNRLLQKQILAFPPK